MPIYEYRCENCGHELEQMQKLSDPVLTDCPACQQPALKKLISAAGFRLKGGGWYETDFKKGQKKNLHEGAEKKESSTSTDAGTGSKDAGAAKSGTDKASTSTSADKKSAA